LILAHVLDDPILEDDFNELLLLLFELDQQFLDVGLMRSDRLKLVSNIIACLRLIGCGVCLVLAQGMVRVVTAAD